MRKFFFLLLILASCKKTEVTPTGSYSPIESQIYASPNPTATIGRWKLTAFAYHEGFNDNGIVATSTSWAPVSDEYILDFNTPTTFSEILPSNLVCDGEFKVSNGFWTASSNCGFMGKLLAFSPTEMIFYTENFMQYRFSKTE